MERRDRVKRTKRLLYAASALLIAAELSLGILLQITSGKAVVLFSYLSVVLACLFCALFCERSAAYVTTQAALLCTVCADWFLVVTEPRRQLPAMLFFSVAQLLYAVRLLHAQSHLARRVHLMIRASLSFLSVLATLLVLGKNCDAVAIVSLFYYVNLVLNILYAFLAGRRERIFAVGLVLFLLCFNWRIITILEPKIMSRLLIGNCLRGCRKEGSRYGLRGVVENTDRTKGKGSYSAEC